MIETTLTKTGEPAVIIEPKDLRIGNVLLYDGKLVHITTLSMDIDDEYQETIGFCELGKSSNEICDWNRALCDKLKPVLLTPEILEQCGFSYKDGEDSFYPTMTKGNFDVNFAVHNGTIQYYGDRIVDTGGDEWLKDIMPLHRFQNLYFALTNEELKITTPSESV